MFCWDGRLFTVMMVHEKALEWNIPICLAAVDFTKAFDTANHLYLYLWEVLVEAFVP